MFYKLNIGDDIVCKVNDVINQVRIIQETPEKRKRARTQKLSTMFSSFSYFGALNPARFSKTTLIFASEFRGYNLQGKYLVDNFEFQFASRPNIYL